MTHRLEHGVAVTMTQWSGTYDADQPIPWHRLSDEASVLAFGTLPPVVPPPGSFSAVGSVIRYTPTACS